MGPVVIAVSLLLAGLSASSAVLLARRTPHIVAVLRRLGVPSSWFPWLSTAKMAGAIGLVIGLWWTPLGVAAAVCLGLYFAGAVITHLREGDVSIGGPGVLLALSAAAAVLHVL